MLPIPNSAWTTNQSNSIYWVESICCFNFVLFSDLFFYHRLKSLVLFSNCISLLILFCFVYIHSLAVNKFELNSNRNIYDFPRSQSNGRMENENVVHFITTKLFFSVYAAICCRYSSDGFLIDVVNKHEGEKKPINFKRCTRFLSVAAAFAYFSLPLLWCWIAILWILFTGFLLARYYVKFFILCFVGEYTRSVRVKCVPWTLNVTHSKAAFQLMPVVGWKYP